MEILLEFAEFGDEKASQCLDEMTLRYPEYPEYQLLDNASKGHLNIVNVLLAANTDVNYGRGYDGTALFMSAQAGHADCVKALLNAAADVQKCTPWFKKSALVGSARAGHADCVKAILEAPVDVGKQSKTDKEMALIVSAKAGHIDCLKLLFEAAEDGWWKKIIKGDSQS